MLSDVRTLEGELVSSIASASSLGGILLVDSDHRLLHAQGKVDPKAKTHVQDTLATVR